MLCSCHRQHRGHLLGAIALPEQVRPPGWHTAGCLSVVQCGDHAQHTALQKQATLAREAGIQIRQWSPMHSVRQQAHLEA